jgi:hypothetical protein
MGLSAVRVDNFRAFGQRATLELRPLTLLFGYNSRGKSALGRTLPLLSASVNKGSSGPLDTRSDAARGATFAEMKSWYGKSATIGFELSWDDDDVGVTRLEARVVGGGFRALEMVERIDAFDRAGARRLQLLLKDDARSRYDVTSAEGQQVEAAFDFEGLVPRALDEGALPANAAALLRDVAARLRSLEDSVHWLAAIRALPERRPPIRGRPARMRSDGANAGEHLAYATNNPSAPGGRAIIDEARAFYREATKHDLHVETTSIGNAPGFSIALSSLEGPDVRVNILDTGEGMAQVLPVAVLGALAKHGALGKSPVVVIEHPELHLHPRAHEEVALFFCRIAASSDARFVIETHSENFLSRVQLAVVRGEIPPEKVLVNWVWQHEAGAAVDQLTLDALGRFVGDGWPHGVFSEDTELHRKIVKERREREGNA